MKIRGVEGMSQADVAAELQRGSRFVVFQYCISVFVMTFKRPSDIYLVKPGESTVNKSLPSTILSLLLGWWGIPWGPIWTVSCVVTNLRGGRDVTQQVMASLAPPKPDQPYQPTAPSSGAYWGQQ